MNSSSVSVVVVFLDTIVVKLVERPPGSLPALRFLMDGSTFSPYTKHHINSKLFCCFLSNTFISKKILYTQ